MAIRPKRSATAARSCLLLFQLQALAGGLGAQDAPVWDSVSAVLGTAGSDAGGYRRFSFPRRDLTVRVGDVTLAPALALTAWVGFDGVGVDAAMMGDLVLLAGELPGVLEELDRQGVMVTAVHQHLVGETPPLVFVHFHDLGPPLALARKMAAALARTGTPRPAQALTAAAPAIDTALVFRGLGRSGRASGTVAQVGFVLVPGQVTLHGRRLVPAMAYGTPINIQRVASNRAVATGDFALTAAQVPAVIRALTQAGITTTAVHSHLVGEEPAITYIHFWAEGPLADVVAGLRAALDAAR